MSNRIGHGAPRFPALSGVNLPGWLLRLGAGVVLLALAALAGLATFPWSLLKGRIERHLSQTIGRAVTIDAMERVDAISFHPRIRLRAIRVPQPVWVRAKLDDLARIDSAEFSLSAWSLLTGHVAVEQADLRGAHVSLYRTAQGRKNWTDGQDKGSDPSAWLRTLRIADSRLRYLDDKRQRSIDVAVASDASGVRLSGDGQIMGHRVRVAGWGAPMVDEQVKAPWSFRIDIDGTAVGFAMEGTMPRPLDTGHMQGQARGHAADLKLLDAIIEAGLPGTQAVRLTARVRRNWPDWTIDALNGTIGRSDLSGHATIVKRHGRTRIDGALSADRFDFGDLSSDDGKQRAAAQRARSGPRLIPASAIDLSHVRNTDGNLDLRVHHLLWSGTSPFRSMTAHVALERSRLEVRPLTLGLTHGTLGGGMVIEQRQPGQRDPSLNVSLALRGARLMDFFPRAKIDGSLVGRMQMRGRGHTVRDAFGVADGRVALVGRDGSIPARTAALLGQDVGGGLTAGKEEMATLRCMVIALPVRGGVARPGPAIIDTSRAQTSLSGTIRLTDERLALVARGAPKGKALLRLPGAVPIAGTIKAPDIRVPARAKSVGGVIGMVVSAITGKQGPRAQDADCATLTARALR